MLRRTLAPRATSVNTTQHRRRERALHGFKASHRRESVSLVGEEAQLPELLVGRVVAVEKHSGARAPSYLLRVELGPRGEVETSIERGSYEREELEGAQVVVVLRGDEALILAARSHSAGLVLLRPDREVEDGTIVS